MAFYVGQKVVCINGTPDADEPPPHPIKGAIYTVSEVFAGEGEPMLQFVEIRFDGDAYGDWQPGFRAACFRPIVERKTDISIFTDMLTPKTEQVSA